MKLLIQILIFSIIPALIFGSLMFLLGWYGGISFTQPLANIPSLGLKDFPFTNVIVESTKLITVSYLLVGIIFALVTVYKNRKTNIPGVVIKVFIITMLGSLAFSTAAHLSLLAIANYR